MAHWRSSVSPRVRLACPLPSVSPHITQHCMDTAVMLSRSATTPPCLATQLFLTTWRGLAASVPSLCWYLNARCWSRLAAPLAPVLGPSWSGVGWGREGCRTAAVEQRVPTRSEPPAPTAATPCFCVSPARRPWVRACELATRTWTKPVGVSQLWSSRWTGTYGKVSTEHCSVHTNTHMHALRFFFVVRGGTPWHDLMFVVNKQRKYSIKTILAWNLLKTIIKSLCNSCNGISPTESLTVPVLNLKLLTKGPAHFT